MLREVRRLGPMVFGVGHISNRTIQYTKLATCTVLNSLGRAPDRGPFITCANPHKRMRVLPQEEVYSTEVPKRLVLTSGFAQSQSANPAIDNTYMGKAVKGNSVVITCSDFYGGLCSSVAGGGGAQGGSGGSGGSSTPSPRRIIT